MVQHMETDEREEASRVSRRVVVEGGKEFVMVMDKEKLKVAEPYEEVNGVKEQLKRHLTDSIG